MSGLTPFQTVGPYLHLGLLAGREPMTATGASVPVTIRGRLLDGAGEGVPDGVLEFWAPGFDGIGRVWTGIDGGYELRTVKPATRVDADGTIHAPHFAVRVLARGILTEYLARVYFADEADNARDLVLQHAPADRRHTLVAQVTGSATYGFDVVLQGDRETVFFDV